LANYVAANFALPVATQSCGNVTAAQRRGTWATATAFEFEKGRELVRTFPHLLVVERLEARRPPSEIVSKPSCGDSLLVKITLAGVEQRITLIQQTNDDALNLVYSGAEPLGRLMCGMINRKSPQLV